MLWPSMTPLSKTNWPNRPKSRSVADKPLPAISTPFGESSHHFASASMP